MEFIITWRELLIAVVLATLVYLLESTVLSKRRGSKSVTDDSEIDKLRAEVAALQRRLDELESRLGAADHSEPEPAHSAYDYAIQYARQGMIAPDIAARCGISRDEAALIVAMHRKGQES